MAATILKVTGALAGATPLTGLLPQLGAPGYVDRHRASAIPGNAGATVADTATWPSDLTTGRTYYIAKSGTNPPNPTLVDYAGVRFTSFVGGLTGWSRHDSTVVTDKTTAFRFLGVPGNAYSVKLDGFVISPTATGWTLSTRNLNGSPTVVATATGALNSPNAVIILILSVSAAGAVRLRVKKNLDPPILAAATGVTPGSDLSFYLGAGAYGSTASGLALGDIIRWNRVLTTAEEDSVFTALALQGANVLASDDFNRADSTSLGTTTTGQNWVVLSGGTGWQISNNQLLSPTAGSTLVYINGGQVDCRLDVKVAAALSANLNLMLLLRETDANNWLSAQISTTDIQILQRVSGTTTTLGTYTLPSAPVAGETFAIQAVGGAVTVYRNGTQVVAGTTTKLTGTNVGFRTSGTGGGGSSWRVDDLLVSPAA